jgi:hypothetical protein
MHPAIGMGISILIMAITKAISLLWLIALCKSTMELLKKSTSQVITGLNNVSTG